jgi:hypothetical protein
MSDWNEDYNRQFNEHIMAQYRAKPQGFQVGGFAIKPSFVKHDEKALAKGSADIGKTPEYIEADNTAFLEHLKPGCTQKGEQ